jgi:hypothetical protein
MARGIETLSDRFESTINEGGKEPRAIRRQRSSTTYAGLFIVLFVVSEGKHGARMRYTRRGAHSSS